MVDFDTPSDGLVAAICSGDSPRARSERIASSFIAMLDSVSSTPLRASRSSSSASACALAARYTALGFLEQPHLLLLQPLQTRGEPLTLSQAPSGASPGKRSPASSLGAA